MFPRMVVMVKPSPSSKGILRTTESREKLKSADGREIKILLLLCLFLTSDVFINMSLGLFTPRHLIHLISVTRQKWRNFNRKMCCSTLSFHVVYLESFVIMWTSAVGQSQC